MSAGALSVSIDEFLKPLAIDTGLVLRLSREFATTFRQLSAESEEQFLPTPISESILRHGIGQDWGRYLAIDIGGSNLRVGFVELLQHGNDAEGTTEGSRVDGQITRASLNRQLEVSLPIGEHLKKDKSDELFSWIGEQISGVVRGGRDAFKLHADRELPLGVTFSFPMKQQSLSEAIPMAMGKGFAMTSSLDLGGRLVKGYEKHRTADMPHIKVAAISNDAVSTLVSFIYQFPAKAHQKAAMGLIVGTGCNATIPLKLTTLHTSKQPHSISVLPDQDEDEVRIAVNTEWAINGSAPALRKLGLISRWDEQLDAAGERPGFQPLEYMTAGRYLGELARLILVDYLSATQPEAMEHLPAALGQRFGLTTTFISHFYPHSPKGSMLEQLEQYLPVLAHSPFQWTDHLANVLFRIAKSIEVRAAGIVAAATVGLLTCAEEIDPTDHADGKVTTIRELVVGYTGGCIQFFQDYRQDCQQFVDQAMAAEYGDQPLRVVLSPCHDGGITGAGILVPAALASRSTGVATRRWRQC